jgi:outer membrane protein OmpA-like peptidoglycan-associated protein
MRASVFATAVSGALLTGAPAFAQADPAQPSVESYLCTFAGKCEAEATATPAVTREAPATKGFSLARPQAAAREAPSTKGFSLARPKSTEPAPATRGFSMAQPIRAKTVPTTPTRVAGGQRPLAARRAPLAVASVARPAPALGAAVAGRKADLMITFEMNSDRMTNLGEARARVFADSMLRPELLDKRFLIEGHTDSVGNRVANTDLSRRRAKAVADYLNAAGVDRTRLEVRGMGFKAPLPGRRTSDPANRRVEAELIS